ncbi:MAG: ATP-binding cassette domain-containing protein [Alloprevotella sp.]|nr:ATP-binding cassette domain-containing protein [Prevotellamassilia sp.]MDY5762654.1 ATP-binding cassette domain-containing protein [Alloprevotella sp.]
MLIDFKNINIATHQHLLLEQIEFNVAEGELVYIIGKVGSGKTSLLKTLYGELRPIVDEAKADEAKAVVLTHNMLKMKRRHLPRLRKRVGMVFQDFLLLHDLTVGENLNFVLRSTGWRSKKVRARRIAEVLQRVGIAERIDAYPHQLSGGEMQRVAIARAIINSPELIFADEPTGNLDRENSDRILSLLSDIATHGTAVVIVTHNLDLINRFPGRVYQCQEGTMTDVTDRFNAPVLMDEIQSQPASEP